MCISSCPRAIRWKCSSPLIALVSHLCAKSVDCRHEGWYLDSQIYSITYMSICQLSYCLNYYSFAVGFEIRKYEFFNFLFFQDSFGSSSLLNSHMNFSTSLTISGKKIAGLLIVILLNLWISSGSIAIIRVCFLWFMNMKYVSIYLVL